MRGWQTQNFQNQLCHTLLHLCVFARRCRQLEPPPQTKIKIICPLLLMVPVKGGLALHAPAAAFIVQLVLSDDKVMVSQALIRSMFVPVRSRSAPAAVNPLKLFCFKFKALVVKAFTGLFASEVLSTLPKQIPDLVKLELFNLAFNAL